MSTSNSSSEFKNLSWTNVRQSVIDALKNHPNGLVRNEIIVEIDDEYPPERRGLLALMVNNLLEAADEGHVKEIGAKNGVYRYRTGKSK